MENTTGTHGTNEFIKLLLRVSTVRIQHHNYSQLNVMSCLDFNIHLHEMRRRKEYNKM